MTALTIADLVICIGICVGCGFFLHWAWRQDLDGPLTRQRVDSDSWPRARTTVPLERDR
jgi:hypothetical protein